MNKLESKKHEFLRVLSKWSMDDQLIEKPKVWQWITDNFVLKPTESLTPKQLRIYNYIKDYIEKNRYSPTYEEMRAKFNYKSIATVYEHVTLLVKRGYIVRDRSYRRGLKVIQ